MLDRNYYENYIPLEWLESTGTQYINTRFNNKEGFRASYELMYTSLGHDGAHLGTIDPISGYDLRRYVSLTGYANDESLGFGPKFGLLNTNPSVDTWYHYEVSTVNGSGNIYVDYNLKANYTDSLTVANNIDLYVFAMNWGGPKSFLKGRVKYFLIYDKDGFAVRYLLPSKRKSDGVVGMYDAIEKVFYINSGTGSFIEGPVLKQYVPLEYIEADGNSYIDTGYIPTINTKIEGVFSRGEEGNGTGAMFGTYGGSNTYLSALCGTNSTNDDLRYIALKFRAQSINTTSTSSTPFSMYLNDFSNKFKVTISKSSYNVDGDAYGQWSYTNSASDFGSSSRSLYILAENNNGSLADIANGLRIYSFDIFENDVKVKSFIPSLKTETYEFGLYDTIGEVFYPNSGTGSFIPGPTATEYSAWTLRYTKLDYIESSGGAMISTKVAPRIFNGTTKGFNINLIASFNENTTGSDLNYIVGSGSGSSSEYNSNSIFPIIGRIGSTGFGFKFGTGSALTTTEIPEINKIYEINSTMVYNVSNGTGVRWKEIGESTYNERTTTLNSYTNNRSMHIFGAKIWDDSLVPSRNTIKLHSASISRNVGNDSIQVRNFVPVKRISDNEVGLFDTINEVFYKNVNTVSGAVFNPGPEVVRYVISATTEDDLPGLVIGGGLYYDGDEVTLNYINTSGSYKFVKWVDNQGTTISTENPYTFKVNENVQIKASLEKRRNCLIKKPYYKKEKFGNIQVNTFKSVDYTTNTTFTSNEDALYLVSGFTNGVVKLSSITISGTDSKILYRSDTDSEVVTGGGAVVRLLPGDSCTVTFNGEAAILVGKVAIKKSHIELVDKVSVTTGDETSITKQNLNVGHLYVGMSGGYKGNGAGTSPIYTRVNGYGNMIEYYSDMWARSIMGTFIPTSEENSIKIGMGFAGHQGYSHGGSTWLFKIYTKE